MSNLQFRIRQNGMTVVQTNSEAAIWHYAWQYRQDGKITIQHNKEGHWKRLALLVCWNEGETP